MVVHLSAPFGQEGKDVHEGKRLEMHGAVGEVNHRPSRSLRVGVNTDEEGALFVSLSAHTLEGEFVSGLRLLGWLWLGLVLVAPLEAEGLVPEVADLHRLRSTH